MDTWKVEKFDTGGPAGPSAEELAKMTMTFQKDGKLSMAREDAARGRSTNSTRRPN